jgi:hypothetical protein
MPDDGAPLNKLKFIKLILISYYEINNYLDWPLSWSINVVPSALSISIDVDSSAIFQTVEMNIGNNTSVNVMEMQDIYVLG